MEAEDNMNVQLQNIQVTARDGRTTQSEQVFIRGSMIRFLILPDMLKNAPMFKPKPTGSRGMGAGGGKSALLRAKGEDFWSCRALFRTVPPSVAGTGRGMFRGGGRGGFPGAGRGSYPGRR